MNDFNFAYKYNSIYKPNREMSSLLINKTPISLLQEWLSHEGKKPNYELLQESKGVINCNTNYFCFRVSVGEASATGSGRSKKEAKHAAARSFLNMMIGGTFAKGQVNFTEMGKLDNRNNMQLNQVNTDRSFEPDIYNPVGKLQEICTAVHWVHPIYTLVSEQGPPHDRLFAISVQVQNTKLVGIGRSKRFAKQEAALRMLKWLSNQNVEEDTDFRSNAVLTNGEETNFAHILQEIAIRNKFDICYEDIEDKTPECLYQCIARISTRPIIVCLGQGITAKHAVNKAAMHVLDCLKIMFGMKYFA